MIQNIEDKNKNKNVNKRRDSVFSGGLSEEELNKLIVQVESQEMLHAPVHLKDNVMTQIRRERQGTRKRQMFAYRAKVLVAMAAALTLVILMPDGRTDNAGYIPIEQQAESLEQVAVRRQEDMDANWEKYLKERESGGVRGLFRSINERITEFGVSLYDDIGAGSG